MMIRMITTTITIVVTVLLTPLILIFVYDCILSLFLVRVRGQGWEVEVFDVS